MKRKILGVTGIRSEYDISYPVFKALNQHKNIKLELAVSGAHLSSAHDYTIKNIKRDKFKIVDEVECLFSGNSGASRAKGIGVLIMGLLQTIERTKPDIIFATGDREEPLAAAIAANYLNIPVAHLFGGDSAINNADDPIRHAISKIAHIHFTACKEHSERLFKMGEEKSRIFEVGNPALDNFLSSPLLPRTELLKQLGFDDPTSGPLLTVLQHPFSSEQALSHDHMKKTMNAIRDLGLKTIVIHPNSDPGSSDIIEVFQKYAKYPNIKIVKNLRRDMYINLLKSSSCLIGNSSSGLLEAPFIKLPAINIGNRQKGRRNSGNVIFIKNDTEEIKRIINEITLDTGARNNIISKIDQYYYGRGNSSNKIAQTLSKIKINKKLLFKINSY
jgi:GDP/UDP-N,N'-diacetylbacillosamine 2-epimerase (hydrolysing)